MACTTLSDHQLEAHQTDTSTHLPRKEADSLFDTLSTFRRYLKGNYIAVIALAGAVVTCSLALVHASRGSLRGNVEAGNYRLTRTRHHGHKMLHIRISRIIIPHSLMLIKLHHHLIWISNPLV